MLGSGSGSVIYCVKVTSSGWKPSSLQNGPVANAQGCLGLTRVMHIKAKITINFVITTHAPGKYDWHKPHRNQIAGT